MEKPTNLTDKEKKSDVERILFSQKVEAYFLRVTMYDSNVQALYSVIMENVTSIMKQKIKEKNGFEAANIANDATWLLESIEDIITNF